MSLHGVVVVVVVWGVRGHLPSPGGTQVGLAVAATCPRRGVRKRLSSSRHVAAGWDVGQVGGLGDAVTRPRPGARK